MLLFYLLLPSYIAHHVSRLMGLDTDLANVVLWNEAIKIFKFWFSLFHNNYLIENLGYQAILLTIGT